LSKILIVEDDQAMTRLLQTLLSLDGYEAIATPRPNEVVSTIRQAKPDLVVMDLNLGQVNTLSIVEGIKSDGELGSIPVVIVSGLDAEEDCARAGADAFMLKPYSPAKLLEIIKKLVR
jgi:two-component system phosphate regulon response regulator PhoB